MVVTQLPSHMLLSAESVREFEVVCPHSYIKVCRSDLPGTNPAARKHELTSLGLRLKLALLLPRTVPQ